MITPLALVLLLAPAGEAAPPSAAAAPPPPAAPPACQVFTRGDASAPQLVHDWLGHSADERVLACPQPRRSPTEAATPIYAGEGAVSRRGAVCSYASHGLTISGSGAAERLRRYESGEATAMALADHDCPPPHPPAAAAYAMTYDVSPAAFLSIMQLWTEVAISVTAFERELACCDLGGAQPGALPRAAGASDVRQRLHGAILAGDMKSAAVTRIVRIPGSTFRRRYALFVSNPTRGVVVGSGFYVIYVQRGLRGPSHIIGVAETE